MSNPTISQIKVGDGVVYDLCDSEVRNMLFNLNNFNIKANNIYIGNKSDADVIKIQSRTRDQNVNFLQIYNGATHGSGLVFGAGGLTVIGGGEAAENIRAKVIADGGLDSNEQLHLGSDNKIYFHSNCNDITTKKTMILDTSGDLTVPGNIIPKSQTKNTIFAAPNGSNGAPSFRALVAADIPNLNASKIASGTLGSDRLPTVSGSAKGAMTAAQYKKLSGIQSGSFTWTTTQADYRYAKSITFSSAYSSAPIVLVTMGYNWATNNSANAEDANGITAVVSSVTTSGATITIWNKELEKNTAVTVYWVAIGSIA